LRCAGSMVVPACAPTEAMETTEAVIQGLVAHSKVSSGQNHSAATTVPLVAFSLFPAGFYLRLHSMHSLKFTPDNVHTYIHT